MRVIEVLISPEGQTQIQTRGFTGASCRQATAALERALGVVRQEQRTAEFYAAGESIPQHRLHER